MNRILTSIVLALVVAAVTFAEETKPETKPVVSQDVLSAPVLPKGIVKTADGVECENRFMMHEWMLTLLDKAEKRWIENYEKAKTPEQIAEYQKARKDFFLKQIGAFPERNPLNAVVTGTIKRDG